MLFLLILRSKIKVKSIRRMIIALLHNFIEIIFWYSIIVITIVKLSNGISTSWFEIISSSMLCMSTFDRSILENISQSEIGILSYVGTCEGISGLIMTVVSLARFIGVLPAVDEIDG